MNKNRNPARILTNASLALANARLMYTQAAEKKGTDAQMLSSLSLRMAECALRYRAAQRAVRGEIQMQIRF